MTGLILRKAALFLILLIISGCSEQKKSSNETEPLMRKKISLVHYFSGNFKGGFDELINNFNKKNPEYELSISALDHEAFKTSILNELQKDNPADIYSYWGGARVQSVVQQLAPIDEIWQSDSLDLRFSQSVINSAVTYNGKKYLLPITQHFVGFFYNKKLFTDYGLSEPQNWDDFLQICQQLKKRKITPLALGAKNKWPAQFWFDYLLLRTASYDYRTRLTKGEAHYTDPEVVRVFQIWSELFAKGYFNQNPNESDWDTGAAESVFRGEAAMTLMGTWLISYFADDKHNWQENADYGFFAFPVIDQEIPLTALGPIDGLVIPARCNNITGALQVLVYLAESESQKIMSRGSGAFAPCLGIPGDFYTPLQQKIQDNIAKSTNWAFNYDLATHPAIAELGLKAFAEFIEFPQYYNKILQKLEKESSATLYKPVEQNIKN